MKIVLLDSGNYFVGPHFRLCVKPHHSNRLCKTETVYKVHDAHLKRDSDEASPCINQFESLHDAFLYCRRVLKSTPELNQGD